MGSESLAFPWRPTESLPRSPPTRQSREVTIMSQVLDQKTRNWHVTEPLFHRVEELYIVAPDLAHIPPLAREFNNATYLTSPPEPFLGYKPSAHRLSPLFKAFFHGADLPNIERIDPRLCLDLDRLTRMNHCASCLSKPSNLSSKDPMHGGSPCREPTLQS